MNTDSNTRVTFDNGERYQVEHDENITFARQEQTQIRDLYRLSPASDVFDTIKVLIAPVIVTSALAAFIYRYSIESILAAVSVTLVGWSIAFCVMVLRSWKLSFLLNIESKRAHTIRDLRQVLQTMLDRTIAGVSVESSIPTHTIMRMSGGVQARALDYAIMKMRQRWNHGSPRTVSGESQSVEEFRDSILDAYDQVIENARKRARDSDVGAIAGEPRNSLSGVDQRSFVIITDDLTDEEVAEKAREAFQTAPESR